MDAKTIEIYDALGAKFSERYRSGKRFSIERVKESFTGCHRVLEIGTGSGIDCARLLKMGFDMTGLEPSRTFIQEAHTHFPETKGRINQGSLPLDEKLREQWASAFDAVYCCAVFMHIPAEKRPACMSDLALVLRTKGRVHFTISECRNGLDEESRDEYGRLYIPLNREDTLALIDSAGFRILQEWKHGDGGQHSRGLNWVSYLLEKPA